MDSQASKTLSERTFQTGNGKSPCVYKCTQFMWPNNDFSDKCISLFLVPAIHLPRLRFNEVHNEARQRSILEVDLFHCLSPFDDLSSS